MMIEATILVAFFLSRETFETHLAPQSAGKGHLHSTPLLPSSDRSMRASKIVLLGSGLCLFLSNWSEDRISPWQPEGHLERRTLPSL